MNSSRGIRIVGIVLIVIGMAGLIYAILGGDVVLQLLFFIPVITIRGAIGILSTFSFVIGSAMFFLSFFIGRIDQDKSRINKLKGKHGIDKVHGGNEWGGVVFLGPIPITFGNRSFREKLPGWLFLLVVGIVFFVLMQIVAVIVFYFI